MQAQTQVRSRRATTSRPEPQPAIPNSTTGLFGQIKLSAPIAQALKDMGYTEPTPIQRQGIPPFLAGDDLVGRAKTGTGKTAAFGIPLAEKVDTSQKVVQALVLVPTRELARQVADELTRIGWYRDLKVLAVYGGEPIRKQLTQLENGVQVVVGTPGRVIDHLQRGSLSFQDVSLVVLDECDEMLDIGFADDIETILRRTPKTRQTGLFSATIPMFVRKLIWKYLHDPVSVEIDTGTSSVELMDQVYFEVAERDKRRALVSILDSLTGDERLLIFRRTQIGVDRLTQDLWNDGFHIRCLHGGMSQPERNRVMDEFKSGKLPLLVATNVAARGIDVEGVTHVVNYDMPDNVEQYVHRIGRTARAGNKGTAISFIGEWDFEMLESVRSQMGDKLMRGEVGFYQKSERAS